MFFLKIKNRKPILYRAYKKSESLPDKKEKIEKSKMKKERQKKDSKKIVIAESKVTNSQKTILISIGNLYGRICSTYLAKATNNYIKKFLHKSVIVVDIKKVNYIEYLEFYDRYDFIILDVGDYSILSEKWRAELKRTDFKFIISLFEEEYFYDLAKLMQTEEAKKYKFIFNLVPKNKIKTLEDLMEGYEYYCLPVFDNAKLDDDIQSIYKKILK